MSANACAADESLVDRASVALLDLGVRGCAVAVAVSGGADSTALLAILAELRNPLQLTVTAAHLDHALRPESALDAAWVAELCQRLQVPLTSRRRAPPLRGQGVSEATARDWRRAFLVEAATSVQARIVATAHTADDQAETVLHRLLRGSGPRGLGGIAPIAPLTDTMRLVRPLLGISRSEIEAWLRARNQAWRTDDSNADLRFTRNRIRQQLLPLLQREFNPQATTALVRLARQCRDVSDWLRVCANEALTAARLEQQSDAVRLDLGKLERLPRVVLRELFVSLWEQQSWPQQAMGFDQWDVLADAANGRGPSRCQLPDGIDVSREGQMLRLRRAV